LTSYIRYDILFIMNNYNRVFCFKINEEIETNDCNRCYKYNRICRNLYKRAYKCFEPSETLSEYQLYLLQKLTDEVAKTLMISTKEVMKFLKGKYGLEIDQSLIFHYAKRGLIKKEQKVGQGYKKGVQTFWEDSAPYKCYVIRQLFKENGITIKDLCRFVGLINNFDEPEIKKILAGNENEYLRELEKLKFKQAIRTWACAEAKEDMFISNKIRIPMMYFKTENSNVEIHVKILEPNEINNGKNLRDKKAYKEIIYSKEGMKIIG